MKKNNSPTKANAVDPTLKAAALKYDGENTPKLVAKGQGKIAQDIISLAEQSDVHVHYDPLLLEVLSKLEMGDEIPDTLFLAVAKIIAFAYYLQGKHPENLKDANFPSKDDSVILDSISTESKDKIEKDTKDFPENS